MLTWKHIQYILNIVNNLVNNVAFKKNNQNLPRIDALPLARQP